MQLVDFFCILFIIEKDIYNNIYTCFVIQWCGIVVHIETMYDDETIKHLFDSLTYHFAITLGTLAPSPALFVVSVALLSGTAFAVTT